MKNYVVLVTYFDMSECPGEYGEREFTIPAYSEWEAEMRGFNLMREAGWYYEPTERAA